MIKDYNLVLRHFLTPMYRNILKNYKNLSMRL